MAQDRSNRRDPCVAPGFGAIHVAVAEETAEHDAGVVDRNTHAGRDRLDARAAIGSESAHGPDLALVETAGPVALDAVVERLDVEPRGYEVGHVTVDAVLVEQEPHVTLRGPEP